MACELFKHSKAEITEKRAVFSASELVLNTPSQEFRFYEMHTDEAEIPF